MKKSCALLGMVSLLVLLTGCFNDKVEVASNDTTPQKPVEKLLPGKPVEKLLAPIQLKALDDDLEQQLANSSDADIEDFLEEALKNMDNEDDGLDAEEVAQFLDALAEDTEDDDEALMANPDMRAEFAAILSAAAEEAAKQEDAAARVASAEAPYLFHSLRFDTDSAELAPGQNKEITTNIQLAKSAVAAGQELYITGHASKQDTESTQLSAQRAEEVKKLFIAEGVAAGSIHVASRGTAQPAVYASTDDLLHTNQRTDIMAA